MAHLECLRTLRRQHHALLPPYLLHIPPDTILASQEGQEYLISHILRDPTLSSRHPEQGYERSFWRKVVQHLERGVEEQRSIDPNSELEVDEVFYEYMASLMVSSDTTLNGVGMDNLPKQSYRTFVYDPPTWSGQRGEGQVTLLEEQVAIQAGTTGLRTWTASLHLAHHIIQSPHILFPEHAPKLPRLLELGAGTGFLSILLSQLGADVTATDLEETSRDGRQAPLERLRTNAALMRGSTEATNSIAPQVRALDWSDALLETDKRPSLWRELSDSPRTIVAADVIYDPDLVPLLVSAVRVLLTSSVSSPAPTAIISATVRNPATLDLFTETCHSSGLQVKDLELEPMNPSNPTFWDSALDAGSLVRIMRVSVSQ